MKIVEEEVKRLKKGLHKEEEEEEGEGEGEGEKKEVGGKETEE